VFEDANIKLPSVAATRWARATERFCNYH